MIETVNQAMNAFDAYCAKHDTPEHGVVAQVHEKLEEHSRSCDDDWQALLDKALGDLGYQVDWHGEEIRSLTHATGEPAPDPLSGSF